MISSMLGLSEVPKKLWKVVGKMIKSKGPGIIVYVKELDKLADSLLADIHLLHKIISTQDILDLFTPEELRTVHEKHVEANSALQSIKKRLINALES